MAAPAVAEAPYTIAAGLFDPSRQNLGLARATGTETVTIFTPMSDDDKFNNGAVLYPFKGRLYAQWQSSATDEDSSDTKIMYASSADGVVWDKPKVLMPAGSGGQMHSNGGWWSDGQTLIAYINVWPTGFQSGDGGYTAYIRSSDGVNWSKPEPVTGADNQPVQGIIEQDPHALADGRIITAFHLRPGMIAAPFFTDDPLGISGWRRGQMTNLPHEGKVSRELEPSLFLRGNCAVMVFRDQASTFKQLASESCDRGQTWTQPALTNMPDARAKQSAGNLPDGTAYMVNAPNGDKLRMPLAVTLSDDGRTFTRSYLLRGGDDIEPLRFEGRYKRLGYHYPKSVVWQDHLYVVYSAHKESIALTRIPLSSLR
nr:sialidase family protein [Asticcacaulis machinosus]